MAAHSCPTTDTWRKLSDKSTTMGSILNRDLDECLSSPLNELTQHTIASILWGTDGASPKFLLGTDGLIPYFKYYTAQCDLALHDVGRYALVRTHRDVLQIVEYIKQDFDVNEIKRRLRATPVTAKLENHDAAIETSINLASRLLLMIELGCISRGFSGRRELRWDQGSLQQYMSDLFNPHGCHNGHAKLEKVFIAQNLPRIARIDIVWTDNLADHLRMLEHDTQVAIFHHASFLQVVRKSKMFPPGFVQETIRSLALLFPQSDKSTEKWYRREAQSFDLDPGLIRSGYLKAEDRNIEAFTYWRDRIAILKQVFDESEPSSWSQWWYDKRRSVHRYPLLVAAFGLSLTAVFGLIQCIEGALQVWKAYHPT